MQSTADNRESTQSNADLARPTQFGIRTLFAITAAVAVLAAGTSAGGWAGFVVAWMFLSIAFYIWAVWTGYKRFRAASILIIVLGFLVALLLPAMQSARINTHGDSCANNLKQLGLALLFYESTHGNLPPAFTLDTNGKPLTSWRTLILPAVDQVQISAQYQLLEVWDSPSNKPLAQQPIHEFQCPSDPGVVGPTSYVAILAPGSAWTPGQGTKLADLKDNPADTILLVEMKNSGIAWAEPRDLDLNNLPAGITSQNLLTSLSAHPGCFNALFADGHVESIPDNIPWADFLALLTIAGGEKIDRSKW